MEASHLPLYQRIARQLKSAIERGELAPGSRLPASRVFAQEQGVSRATIENAWGELVAQGWLERRGQAGTFVSERLSPRQLAPVPPVPPAQPAAPAEPLPFQMGLPALDLFPRGLWARVMGRRLRTQSRFDLAPGDPGGDPLLRQAIVDYLRLSRSIDCQPEQVLIAGNYATAMNLILRTLAHQSPLGVALSLPRRRQLLAWAAERDAWIIEDDYDSEFRYRGKPLPPLKSLDAPQRVIYAGTFSKSMFPALRTAWLVVPTALAARFHQTVERQPCTVPTLWQQTLADFIQQGHFWRHLKKMRASYSQRREWLESALQAQGFQVTPQQGGIQLVMPVNGDDRLLAQRAVAAGLAVQALSDWRMRHTGEGGLLMSFTNIRSPAMAGALARRLREAIGVGGVTPAGV
ncbi:aminotransferase-like domain-containing protein [Klebsiella quasipneumoniae]|uniref:aminotransferase-like domain-containing protein n=1 Tax=Klebsiella quasipneumoniae TaxID=1463165 RepID=UPI001495D5D9|nr:PLP-dependent aminotransferase family protein [Klebsiella quasipneumoniae]